MNGRPSKYNEQILISAIAYVEEAVSSKSTPFIEELALHLGVSDDTIVEWAKLHEDFSATIQKLKTYQKLCLLKGGLEKRYHANFALFLLKANHGMDAPSDDSPRIMGGYIVLPEKKPEGYGATV
jgi:hypothetical protein|tara:strand:+ start:78 stop:452 length:375 start_codon:yes stop_codon:yes gene_type:complete